MTIRGIVVMAGEGTEGLAEVKAYEVEGSNYLSLFRKCGIEYGERVNTRNGAEHGFVSFVDDEGHRKFLPINRVGEMISGYPGRLLGNILFVSEAMGDEGMDVISLSDKGRTFIFEQLQREVLPKLTNNL